MLFACKLRLAAGADSTPTAVPENDRGMHLDCGNYVSRIHNTTNSMRSPSFDTYQACLPNVHGLHSQLGLNQQSCNWSWSATHQALLNHHLLPISLYLFPLIVTAWPPRLPCPFPPSSGLAVVLVICVARFPRLCMKARAWKML